MSLTESTSGELVELPTARPKSGRKPNPRTQVTLDVSRELKRGAQALLPYSMRIADFWEPDMTRSLVTAWKAARNMSAKEGELFDLSVQDLTALMERSLGRCEISGIPFNGDNFSLSRRRPFVPSIDRIEPKGPYSLGNCRLVCWIVNLAVSDWGDDVFWVMVKAASKKGRYTKGSP